MNARLGLARIFTASGLLVIIGGMGCASPPVQPSEVTFGPSFELRAGTSATLSGGLKVTFDRVTSDSRCPMDVVCVWAGDATISLRLSQSAGGQVERELHTIPSGSEASYLAYLVKLVALTPYPRSDRPIRPDDYVATLTVESR